MDVPHSLFKCNFSAGTMSVNVKYSPCPWSLAKIFGYSVIVPQYTLARWKTQTKDLQVPQLPIISAKMRYCIVKDWMVCYLNVFFLFTDICPLYSLWCRKAFHLATVKLCTSCSQTADRKAWSLKSEMKFHFCCGGKNFFKTGLNELYFPMQRTV